MRILIAPLNWGLGHASRMIPLVQRFLNEGHDVVLGGDGESLTLLRKHFPHLRYTFLAPLQLRYSASHRQVGAIVRSLPSLIRWAIRDHRMLSEILREEHFDLIISDNRFGLYTKQTECIYITHQLHIMLPHGWRWLEGIAQRAHARIYTHYNKVWVPDHAAVPRSLAGELSHPTTAFIENLKVPIEYIGPLSRFSLTTPAKSYSHYDIVAVLSGLEPQRSIFEKEICHRYEKKNETVLIVQGLYNRPYTQFKRANITIVPYLGDNKLIAILLHAQHIIARSGYSSIMDFEALNILAKAELIPTPGQPEQSYLATYIGEKWQKE